MCLNWISMDFLHFIHLFIYWSVIESKWGKKTNLLKSVKIDPKIRIKIRAEHSSNIWPMAQIDVTMINCMCFGFSHNGIIGAVPWFQPIVWNVSLLSWLFFLVYLNWNDCMYHIYTTLDKTHICLSDRDSDLLTVCAARFPVTFSQIKSVYSRLYWYYS